jgi:hypothetical protein
VNLSIRHSAQTTRGCGFLSASHAHQLRQAIVSSHRCRRHLLIHIDLRAILRILHSVDLEAFVARFFPRISARCLRLLLRYRTIPLPNFTSDTAKGGINALEQRQRASPNPNLPLGSARSSHHAKGVCNNNTLPQVIGLSHHLPGSFQTAFLPQRFGFSATRNLLHGTTKKEALSCCPYCVSGTLFTAMKVLENRRNIYQKGGHSIFCDDTALVPISEVCQDSFLERADCPRRARPAGSGLQR